jgi:hypothetical protein
MKRFLAPGLLVLFFIICSPGSIFAQCGVERWPVKTGADADVWMVNLTSTNATTINSLRGLSAPNELPDNSRVQPTETTVFVLNATLTKFVRAYDSDYHMVLTDELGRTMIAEIPAPSCVGPGSPLAAGIAHARAQFDAMFSATTTFQTVNVPVQVTGVGFFDHQEGQEGIAPNGIELHPIVDIVFKPYFTLSSSPQSLTIARGSSGSSMITSALNGNFNSSVSLSASGLPAGANAMFSPSSISAPGAGSSLLTISLDGSAPVGDYAVTVKGTGAGQTHSTVFSLTVTNGISTQQVLGNAGFENGSANPSPWSVTAGVIDSSGFQASHAGTWKAWLNGYGSAHTDTLWQTASISSAATSATLSYWLHIDTTETQATANDTLKVQIRNSSGAVLATLATYSNRDAAAGFRLVSFDISSYKGQTIQVYLIGVENTKLKTSFVVDDFALNVSTSGATGDFVISASPSALSLVQGGSGTSTINTTVSGGFNSAVALTASGLPAGATASFSPASIAAPGGGAATVTFLAGSAAATGTYSVTVTGTGGGKTHTTVISLTVSPNGGGTQQLLGNPGFENGSANPSPWSVTSGVIDSSSYQASHGGSWRAWLNGYGIVHTDTLLQTVTIPSTAKAAALSFWLHIDTLETTTTTTYDTMKVQVRNSSGTVLATLATYSNLTVISGYTQASFDLSSYKGQTIQIYLVGVEDSSLKTSFVVDDFALNVTP